MNHAVVAPNLAIIDGRPVTTSLNVAEVFGKKHHNVMQAIAALNFKGGVPDEFSQLNFERTSYLDANGQARPMYHITKDGFTLLAMGFTGKAAMRFKLAYIAAFNAMEAELLGRADEAGRKRVEVNHSHLRATNAPGGLDIRYTMDLTKIVMSPNPSTLALLSRLTGLDFDAMDFPLPAHGKTPVQDQVARFVAERCRMAPSQNSQAIKLYDAFASWCIENRLEIITLRAWGDAMSELFTKVKAGVVMYKGVVLRSGAAAGKKEVVS